MRLSFKYATIRRVYGTPQLYLNEMQLDRQFRNAREFADFIQLLIDN